MSAATDSLAQNILGQWERVVEGLNAQAHGSEAENRSSVSLEHIEEHLKAVIAMLVHIEDALAASAAANLILATIALHGPMYGKFSLDKLLTFHFSKVRERMDALLSDEDIDEEITRIEEDEGAGKYDVSEREGKGR